MTPDRPNAPPAPRRPSDVLAASSRHFVIGWVGLAIAMVGGLLVDLMLGLKLGLYLDVDNQTRRLLWRLAHAHAAGFSLVHLVFAAYLSTQVDRISTPLRAASQLATIGLIALPAGFALGGAQLYGDDPGLAIFLAPVGGVAMTLAAACIVWDAYSRRRRGFPATEAGDLPRESAENPRSAKSRRR